MTDRMIDGIIEESATHFGYNVATEKMIRVIIGSGRYHSNPTIVATNYDEFKIRLIVNTLHVISAQNSGTGNVDEFGIMFKFADLMAKFENTLRRIEKTAIAGYNITIKITKTVVDPIVEITYRSTIDEVFKRILAEEGCKFLYIDQIRNDGFEFYFMNEGGEKEKIIIDVC